MQYMWMSIFRSNNDEIIQENHKNHHKYFMRVRPRQAKVDKKQTVTQSETKKNIWNQKKQASAKKTQNQKKQIWKWDNIEEIGHQKKGYWEREKSYKNGQNKRKTESTRPK